MRTLAAVLFLIYVTPVYAEPTCPEQLDEQKRKTLTLSLKLEKVQETVVLLETQKGLFLDNEALHTKSSQTSNEIAGKYKGLYEDADKRAQRQWYEHPGLWFGIGVAFTLGMVATSVIVYERVRAPNVR